MRSRPLVIILLVVISLIVIFEFAILGVKQTSGFSKCPVDQIDITKTGCYLTTDLPKKNYKDLTLVAKVKEFSQKDNNVFVTVDYPVYWWSKTLTFRVGGQLPKDSDS